MVEARAPYSGPKVGDVIGGKYRLVRQIGQGGMGTVFEAQYMTLGRGVALKFLQSRVAHDLDLIERFMREARAAAAISHPRIIDVFDVGWTDDGLIPYFAMELLDGQNLTTELKNSGPMAVDRAISIVSQVLDALEAAHSNGIVHRDLKPENVFVIRHGIEEDVKVLDFGISKIMGTTGGSLTHTGAVLGTPAYMSPEQARGARQIDHRTDIYAAGAILFELITGRPPYEGETYNEIIIKIATEPPPSITSLRPGVHAALVAVVERALTRDPAARWASATAMATALSEVIDATAHVTGQLTDPAHAVTGQLTDPSEPSYDTSYTPSVKPTPTAWEVTHESERPPAGAVEHDPEAEEQTREVESIEEPTHEVESIGDDLRTGSGVFTDTGSLASPRPRSRLNVMLALAIVGILTGAVTFAVGKVLGGDDPAGPIASRAGGTGGLRAVPLDPLPFAPVPSTVSAPVPHRSDISEGTTAATPERRCRIRASIVTAGASARLDGVPVGPEIDLPSDCGSPHELRVWADGFETRELTVQAAEEGTIEVQLDRSRTPSGARHARKGRQSKLEPNPF